MALNQSAPKGALKFKTRGSSDKKKVMIYGNDGTGKSTFAEEYCEKNGLKPVCIDIDDTNFTNVPIVEIDLSTDLNTFKSIKEVITQIRATDDFDTIIVDGVTSLLELLVSKSKGLSKYGDRSVRFQDILRLLLSSDKHLIFIGQADMEVIYTTDHQSNKSIIKVNSIVNEKYHCYITSKGEYAHEVMKYRTFEGETVDNETNDIKELCQSLKESLEIGNKPVTKSTMKSQAVKMIKAGAIESELRPQLIQFIEKHCPEELD